MVTAMNADPINAIIAGRVIAARRSAGMSRANLAIASGVAERTLARRESGLSAWTTDELAAVATALHVEVVSFVAQPTGVAR